MNSLLSVKQVAKYLGVHPRTVSHYVHDLGLPSYKIEGGLRFDKEEVLDWVKNHKIKNQIAVRIYRHNIENRLTKDARARIDGTKGENMAATKKGRRRFPYGIIYKRETGASWTLDYTDPQTGKRIQRVAKGCETVEEAHEALVQAALLDAITKPNDCEHRKHIDFTSWAEIFLSDHSKAVKRSWKSDRSRVKAMVEHFGNTELRGITPLMIQKLIASRRNEGNSKSTANRYLTLLKTMLYKAIGEGYLEQNPATKVKPYSEKNIVKERILSEDEEARLIAECSPTLQSVLKIMLNAGLRPSEVFNLQWRNVDLERMLLTVEETKDDEVRRIPINRVLYEEFTKLKKDANHSRFVFYNEATGRPITTVRTAFRAACRRTGLNGVRLYDARHTFACRLIRRGADIETVRVLLGHSDIRITMRYVHSNDAVKRAALELLEPKRDHFCDNSVTKSEREKTCKSASLLISMN
jgi:excisionase family DNA binding protein